MTGSRGLLTFFPNLANHPELDSFCLDLSCKSRKLPFLVQIRVIRGSSSFVLTLVQPEQSRMGREWFEQQPFTI
jgi:hypothetical protein